MAGGAVLLFIGVALVARYIVRPLAGAIGWPLERAFDEPGRLARENAMRNPGRTATTSAALMVGLALVVFVAVFAAGLKASITGSLDDARASRPRSSPPRASSRCRPTPQPEAAPRRRRVRAMGAVHGPDRGQRQAVNATTDTLDGVAPAAARLRLEVAEGRLRRAGRPLRGDTALVEEQFAKTHGIAVGDRFRIETPSGGRRRCWRSASTATRRSCRASSSTSRPSSACRRSRPVRLLHRRRRPDLRTVVSDGSRPRSSASRRAEVRSEPSTAT